jgi:FixJ family two-component response regulator/signal transduction histidine kinase
MSDPGPSPGPGAAAFLEALEFERLLADLSAGFVNLPPDRVDGAITDALRRIAATLGADRSQLIRFNGAGHAAVITHSGALEGVPGVWATQRREITDLYPYGLPRIKAGHAFVVPCLDDLPPEASVDKASLQRAGVKSSLVLPMRVAGKIEGGLAIGSMRNHRAWAAQLIARIGAVADVLANALAHKRAQEGLDAAIGFERLTSRILASLLTAPRADLDDVIEAGLGEMAKAFGAERATLWQRVGNTDELVESHRWLGQGVAIPDTVGAMATPWISGRLVSGAVVRFARHADLPREAGPDLPGLRSFHIRAAVAVPLAVSGAVVGALAFATSREDAEWPEELVPRARLFGEVLASVLARQAAERREQDAQAQAAHAARVGTMGVVAASLVHELTQPLAASLANAETAAELLEAARPDLDELRATVADIVADDRRVGDLIQQLRKFLRRGEVERSEVRLGEVLAEVLRLAGNQAAEKAVAIAIDLPDALPSLLADRVQLQQVLLNLLLNAIDAASAKPSGVGRVSVLARSSGERMTIEVSDTGRGMDEQTLGRVFQPFFTTKPGGMGLGLSISRSIVAAHGGTLSVRSSPGEGTTFRVELPLRPPAEAPAAALSAPVPAPGTGTVFVIDDDPSMRRALERQLEGAGYRVEAFASAQDYLDRAPDDGTACIVSDVRMPGLSGLDLQASLARAGRDLPMVFVSGHGDVPTTAHAMKAGAVGFLAKPFSKGELLAAVAEALARDRELEAARRERAELRTRYESLTPREREVFALVAAGLLNKLIADRLGAAEGTVKIHRGRMMEKMHAGSVADLVRMAERLGLEPAAARSPD